MLKSFAIALTVIAAATFMVVRPVSAGTGTKAGKVNTSSKAEGWRCGSGGCVDVTPVVRGFCPNGKGC